MVATYIIDAKTTNCNNDEPRSFSPTSTNIATPQIANNGALDINGVSQTVGNLIVTTGGAITQSGAATVSGTANFSAGANPMTLNNAANDFTGAVTLTNSGANDVAIRDVNAIQLAASTIGRNLAVTANGAISQTGIITAPGTTTLQAGAGNINLPLANDFGSVGITSANNATINDSNNLTLNAAAVTNTLAATTAGTLTVAGAVVRSAGSRQLLPPSYQTPNSMVVGFDAFA